MFRGLVTAFRTLSILPVPGPDAEDKSESLPWFPLVGCLLGALVVGVGALPGQVGGPWPEAAALLMVIGSIVITRGLHLDGLADAADAFGGAWDRERTLAIMKDPHAGTFGILALLAVLGAKWVAMTRLATLGLSLWVVGVFVISRAAMADLAFRLPYARAEGGTAAPFVGKTDAPRRMGTGLAAGLILSVCFGPAGLAGLILGWLLSMAFGAWCRHRVGGITGDLLGACNEIVETASLLLAAALADRLPSWMEWSIL